MSAADDVRREVGKVDAMARDVFVGVVLAAHESIKFGSSITGAPGQPVQTSNLRNSWDYEFDTPESASITTNVEYAEAIEDGVGPHGPMTLRSAVGGFHSVKQTVAGMQRLVDSVVARTGGRP